MVKGLSRYLKNILFCVGILIILTLFILSFNGPKEGYSDIFLWAILLSPVIIILIPKNSLRTDVTFTVVMILVISLYAYGYWEFRDRPMLYPAITNPSPEELMGGWFSFENRLRLDLMIIWGIIPVAVSVVIRTILTKIKVAKS